MTKEFLFDFISQHKLAVVSTVTQENTPESALVGIAVTPDLHIVFDTVIDSRKYKNLLLNNSIAFVIGCVDEVTLQYEGIATIPQGEELHDLKQIYFKTYPDGKIRERDWHNITYIRAIPKWIRFTDYREGKTTIEEIKFNM